MIPGHSPKLDSCQVECPYPCDYVNLFGDGDVMFLAMMPLKIRFSSSSLLTCCLRSIISFRNFPVTAKAPCTQGCCIAAGEQAGTMQKDTEPGTGDRGPKGPKFRPQMQIKEEAYAINKITTVSTNKGELSIWYGHSPWQLPSLGGAPISYHHHFYLYHFS